MSRTKTQPRRDAIFRWDHRMRTAVHLLTSEFDLTHQRRADVFNQVFANELAARQCPDGLRVEKVTAQASESRKTETAKCWIEILAPPPTPEEKSLRDDLRARIRQAVQAEHALPTSSLIKPTGGNILPSPRRSSTGAPPPKPTANSARICHQRERLTNPVPALPSSRRRDSDGSTRLTSRHVQQTLSSSNDEPVFVSHTLGSTSSMPLPQTPPRALARTFIEHSLSHDFTTPPSSRKRQAPSAIDLTDEGDDDIEQVSLRLKRARVVDANTAIVPLFPVIKRREASSRMLEPSPQQVLRTPPKTRVPQKKKKKGTPKEKFSFSRPDGSLIKPDESKRAGTLKDLVPISARVAEPPRPDLVFRYWEKQVPNNHNSEEGFVARKFFGCNVNHFSLLKSQDIDLTDIFNHMNREMVKSRFISTCNRLLWIVRLAIQELKKGTQNGRISVIDTSVLKKRALLWARPFHDEITEKKLPWTKGAEKYRGSYEFLVQGAIPREAILSTIKVSDLYRLPQLQPSLGHLLRFEIIMNSASLAKKEEDFRRQAIPLDGRTTQAIAQLTSFFGLGSNSPIAHISHIVADIVEGWHLSVAYQENHEWQGLAVVFSRSFLGGFAEEPVGFVQKQAIKMAFLDGVRWAQGGFNAKHKEKTVVKMQKKAKSIGLECPAKIVTDELDAVKLRVWSHENRIANMLKQYNIQHMVENGGVSSDKGEDDDMQSESPTPGPSRRPQWEWTRQLAIEDDDDDVHFGSEIEFDDNGHVV